MCLVYDSPQEGKWRMCQILYTRYKSSIPNITEEDILNYYNKIIIMSIGELCEEWDNFRQRHLEKEK